MQMRNVLDLPRRLAGAPGATKLQREVIEQAIQQLDFVEANAPLDRDMRYSLAYSYHSLGGVQGSWFSGHLGNRPEALASFADERVPDRRMRADRSALR